MMKSIKLSYPSFYLSESVSFIDAAPTQISRGSAKVCTALVVLEFVVPRERQANLFVVVD